MTLAKRNLQDLQTEDLTPDELEALRGLLYALDMIRNSTGHGSMSISVVDNQASEFDIQIRVRPKISAPWRIRKPQ